MSIIHVPDRLTDERKKVQIRDTGLQPFVISGQTERTLFYFVTLNREDLLLSGKILQKREKRASGRRVAHAVRLTVTGYTLNSPVACASR
jgi:hypothetical protein